MATVFRSPDGGRRKDGVEWAYCPAISVAPFISDPQSEDILSLFTKIQIQSFGKEHCEGAREPRCRGGA